MPTPPDLNHHATNYVWNAVANTIPDALTLLAMIAAGVIAYLVMTRGATYTAHTVARWPVTTRARNIAAAVTVFAFAQSFLWLWIVDHFMYQYDYPGTWCWTCSPILDALGETTENCLWCALFGVMVGTLAGIVVRSVRSLRTSHAH